jgi:hypothetical protein
MKVGKSKYFTVRHSVYHTIRSSVWKITEPKINKKVSNSISVSGWLCVNISLSELINIDKQ